MFTTTIGDYTLIVDPDGLPTEERIKFFRIHADLYERFTFHGDKIRTCFVAVRRNVDWWPVLPFLVVQMEYMPMQLGDPGVMLLPDTGRLFIGAGRRLVCYQLLDEPERLWESHALEEFFSWQRHGDVVIMAGLNELAAWDTKGNPLWWSDKPEHQWSYRVVDETVKLEIGTDITEFNLESGPSEQS